MPRLSWPELHGAFTHFPIALLITAMAFDLGGIALRRSEGRLISFWLLLVTVLMAIPALVSGWITAGQLYPASDPDVVVRHRAAAFATSGLALLLLAWRCAKRDQLVGPALFFSIFLMAVAAAGAGYVGFLGGKMVLGGLKASDATNGGQQSLRQSSPQEHRATDPRRIEIGSRLFESNNCQTCHRFGGAGGTMGPDLTHEARRHSEIAWQVEHLKDPGKVVPGSTMPSFSGLRPAELNDLAVFLVSRN